MGVCDNQTFFALPEDFCQHAVWNYSASQYVGKHVTSADAWELVFIANKDEFAVTRKGFQKVAHKGAVHHGHLVANHGIHFKWVAFVVHEITFIGLYHIDLK